MGKRLACALLCLGLLSGCGADLSWLLPSPPAPAPRESLCTLEDLPAYSGESAVELNGSLPSFPDGDKTSAPFERYSPLDGLGRCGPAYANVGPETMPTEERGAIGMVRPSGWQLAKYDFVEGKYLYNRCHLIGFQLTGENANAENLITGTRYLNTVGMLPYENQVADYVRQTGNHVLYRATPIFEGEDLVCSGVELEGWSVEDEGEGICFHVYLYNVQPGVVINYATGESRAEEEPPPESPAAGDTPEPAGTGGPKETGAKGLESAGTEGPEETGAVLPPEAGAVQAAYVVNVKSGKFHLPTCAGVATMSEDNRLDWTGGREDLIEQGYLPCGTCRP